ncbi:hypothetical protein [Streptomyces sp. NPDC002533]
MHYGLVDVRETADWKSLRNHNDHCSQQLPRTYQSWQENSFYGENLAIGEAVCTIQMRRLAETSAVPRTQPCTLACSHRVSQRNSKLDVRSVTPTAEHRNEFLRLLEERSIPTFTLDRYFLPDRPVLRDRKSFYSDSFPWNLVEGDLCMISRDRSRPD